MGDCGGGKGGCCGGQKKKGGCKGDYKPYSEKNELADADIFLTEDKGLPALTYDSLKSLFPASVLSEAVLACAFDTIIDKWHENCSVMYSSRVTFLEQEDKNRYSCVVNDHKIILEKETKTLAGSLDAVVKVKAYANYPHNQDIQESAKELLCSIVRYVQCSNVDLLLSISVPKKLNSKLEAGGLKLEDLPEDVRIFYDL